MMMKVKQWIYVVFWLLVSKTLWATHNRAGEITYFQLDDLTIQATVTTYTKTSSREADRDSLTVLWGDGASSTIARSNGKGTLLGNDIQVNYYTSIHKYPSVGRFTISMLDPNRVDAILNIDFPNSVNIPFFIQTTFSLLDLRYQGINNSAILLQSPIDFACVGEKFIHNPNAYDLDGDSLSYELATPLMDVDKEVPRYQLPNEISPGIDNSISLNPTTGEFIWDAPKIQGEYNITIRIKEYRKGVLINIILRDMQIFVRSCNNKNQAPTINSIQEICVEAGEQIRFPIEVFDIDSLQKVKIEVTGGPFLLERQPAQILNLPQGYQEPPINMEFVWNTDCNHINKEGYQIVIKATDNFFNGKEGLSSLKTINIHVVAPAPIFDTAYTIEGGAMIRWKSPYLCEDTEDIQFDDFNVWRANESKGLNEECKAVDLATLGYRDLKVYYDFKDSSYFAIDSTVSPNSYNCYRVTASFSQKTNIQVPYNLTRSKASEEQCIYFKRQVPLVSQADILQTSNLAQVGVQWVSPSQENVDSIVYPPPYYMEMSKSTNGLQFVQLPKSGVVVNRLNETVHNFVDESNNTIDQQIYYKVGLYNGINRNLIGESNPATTLRLDISPSQNDMVLNWNSSHLWKNDSFEIQQEDEFGQFQSIAWTYQNSYKILKSTEDSVCFRVKSVGHFDFSTPIVSTINHSQKQCAVFKDKQAPCEVSNTQFDVINSCKAGNESVEALINIIRWNTILCSDDQDLSHYNLYFRKNYSDEPLTFLDKISKAELSYTHTPENTLAYCYAISTVDEVGNESKKSDEKCVENCYQYRLPNAFTPNGDGKNDIFKPLVNRFVSEFEIEIYNRWGSMVFQTIDPQINWDGRTNKGANLPTGVYYYKAKISNIEQGITQKIVLQGNIHLLK